MNYNSKIKMVIEERITRFAGSTQLILNENEPDVRSKAAAGEKADFSGLWVFTWNQLSHQTDNREH